MASVEENRNKWNSYKWPEAGDEWSAPWGDSNQVWWGVLFPRIGRFLPTATVLEIASGYGRWTRYLQQFCQGYIGVDVSEPAVEACRRDYPDLQFHVTDGVSVPLVKDRSISFCFSYDSLVHVDIETLRAYIEELNRILTDDGVAFLHHSNLGAYRKVLQRKAFWARFVPSWRVRRRLRLVPETGWRDPNVTADIVREFCVSQGLHCRQELITWIETDGLMIDCFTLVSRASVPFARVENRGFGSFASQMKLCFEHYGGQSTQTPR